MAGNKCIWKDDMQPQNGNLFHQSPINVSTYSLADKDNLQNHGSSSKCADECAKDSNSALELRRHIHLLFMQQKYTDVKFVINSKSDPKPILRAHKAILAVGSDTFKKMFYDDESNSSSGFLIKNISYDAFKNVVEYLYTYDICFENEVSAMETWSAALKFKIHSLLDKCEHYLETVELTENSVCTIFQLATNHELASLGNKCEEFIQKNTTAVLRSPDFLAVNKRTVFSICKMEKLNLNSEIELLKGVLRWVESQSDVEKNKELVIKSFLSNIRFLTLTCNEFNQFIQDHPFILTAPEVSSILTQLKNPTQSTNLPSWCNKSLNRCATNANRMDGQQMPKQQQFQKNAFPPDQYFSIPLKPSKENQFFTNLKCVIQLNNKTEIHVIKGIRFAFEHTSGLIAHLMIRIVTKNTKFNFEEHFTNIVNTKNFYVRFSKVIPIHPGQSVIIKAEAFGIRNYKFLQFDDFPSLQEESPFVCSLASEPKAGRFFFISDVVYRKSISNGQYNRK